MSEPGGKAAPAGPREAVILADERPQREMRHGRGIVHDLVGPAIGCKWVDAHVNVIRPGSGQGPAHYHSNADNVYLVLEGMAAITVEDRRYQLSAGDAIFIPAWRVHSASNPGDAPLQILELYAPGGADFHEVTSEGTK